MPEPARGAAPKVLFVDDERNILSALSRLFADEPYEIATASSGAEGLEILRGAADTAVIVTDQRMPEMTGIEFLVQARKVAPQALRILLTGYADLDAVVDAINRGGAYRFATKPWTDAELLLTLRDAVQRYELLRENERLGGLVRRQNEELKEWNRSLEERVAGQTHQIRRQNQALHDLNARLRKSFDDTLSAFANLLELRDPTERHHSSNVAAVAEAMAAAAGLPADEIETVRIAALLHDIGKVGEGYFPPQKEIGSFTPEQWRLYKEHAVRGQTVVDSVEALRTAGVLIRHHHERWDGSGFPDGLRGDAIPAGARILGLSDLVDREAAKCRGGNASDLVLAVVRSEKAAGRIDPALLPIAVDVVPEACARTRPAVAAAFEEEIAVRKLRKGMVLSRDALSGTGVLLLRGGTVLDASTAAALARLAELDPSRTGVFVFRERNAL
jgi:putative nucleotidyltransferase with HDIG domain